MSERVGCEIHVRGLVQGVGFRPTVWRLAQAHGLEGEVSNDSAGVCIRLWGRAGDIEAFVQGLRAAPPPLAHIEAITRHALDAPLPRPGFHIVASAPATPDRKQGTAQDAVHKDAVTGVLPDIATCPACLAEIQDPADRRYRYAFTNCTDCGPRLSIVRAIPYDRARTAMAGFTQCPSCQAEYDNPADRRFHAQPNACAVCGPRLWLVDRAGEAVALLPGEDVPAAASRLLREGQILAIKGIGGFHLACDAGNPFAVAALRARKQRDAKPFALMARDVDVIRRYCQVDETEAALLAGPAAPIVVLDRLDAAVDSMGDSTGNSTADGAWDSAGGIAAGVASNTLATLGFMLPYSPLHHLLLADWDTPLVMTSGNPSETPQCIANDEARQRLGAIADVFLFHDRDIVNRADDSVARVVERVPRLLRRARGYAPAPLSLPSGFAAAPSLIALGGELKNTLCLLQDGHAVLTPHLGDLEEARSAAAFEAAIARYCELLAHTPRRIAVDLHTGYRSSRYGRDWAAREGLALERVQHHHAHIAACLAEHGWPLAREEGGGAVLGIALDGLGYGEDGTLWGGEFLLADYVHSRRLAHLRPLPLPGGAQAMREPWRNTYAHIAACLGWSQYARAHAGLALTADLAARPLAVLDTMLDRGLNSPLSSACGRWFDAVAGALGVCRERIAYEGQAAIELETLAAQARDTRTAYPFAMRSSEATGGALPVIDPTPMWQALFADLARGTTPAECAARFHRGLAQGIAGTGHALAREHGLDTVALSGGVFQNRLLFTTVAADLRARGLRVLGHSRVPCNDGGLALGQAVVAAARCL